MKIQPAAYAPELATSVDHAPPGHWLIEPKLDGYRMGALHDGKQVRLVSRNGKIWNGRCPQISAQLKRLLPPGTIVDGELVADAALGTASKSKHSFQALQRQARAGATAGLTYFIFDILTLRGTDLRPLSLKDRKQILKSLLPDGRGAVRLLRPLRGPAHRALESAIERGYEGIILKRTLDSYVPGRGTSWLKMKRAEHEEFAILGWSPHSKRAGLIGSLLLALRVRPVKWLYCGKVGTGFSDADRTRLRALLSSTKTLPSADVLNLEFLPRGSLLVTPSAVGEVEFTEWTDDGMLRHPVFLGLRQDKSAFSVDLDGSTHPLRKALRGSAAQSIESGGKGAELR